MNPSAIFKALFGAGITGGSVFYMDIEGSSGTLTNYYIIVSRHKFYVSKKIYNWLSKRDTVVVHYWPHSKTVAKVEKMVKVGAEHRWLL